MKRSLSVAFPAHSIEANSTNDTSLQPLQQLFRQPSQYPSQQTSQQPSQQPSQSSSSVLNHCLEDTEIDYKGAFYPIEDSSKRPLNPPSDSKHCANPNPNPNKHNQNETPPTNQTNQTNTHNYVTNDYSDNPNNNFKRRVIKHGDGDKISLSVAVSSPSSPKQNTTQSTQSTQSTHSTQSTAKTTASILPTMPSTSAPTSSTNASISGSKTQPTDQKLPCRIETIHDKSVTVLDDMKHSKIKQTPTKTNNSPRQFFDPTFKPMSRSGEDTMPKFNYDYKAYELYDLAFVFATRDIRLYEDELKNLLSVALKISRDSKYVIQDDHHDPYRKKTVYMIDRIPQSCIGEFFLMPEKMRFFVQTQNNTTKEWETNVIPWQIRVSPRRKDERSTRLCWCLFCGKYFHEISTCSYMKDLRSKDDRFKRFSN